MLVPSMLALRNNVVHCGARRMSMTHLNTQGVDNRIRNLRTLVILANLGYGLHSGFAGARSSSQEEFKKQRQSGKINLGNVVLETGKGFVMGTTTGLIVSVWATIAIPFSVVGLSAVSIIFSPFYCLDYVLKRMEDKS